jgi:Domain of Unknown Function (DUF928)
MKNFQPLSSLTLLGILIGVVLPSLAAPVKPSKSAPRPSPIRWNPPPPPPNLGDPGGRGQGGGSRGDCKAYEGMKALLPGAQTAGLTTQEHPTFWLNFPNGLADQVPLEMSLQTPQGKPIFKKIWNATPTPAGIVHMSLPQDAPALQLNQRYRWSISIYCDADNPDTPITVRGTIARTALSPTVNLTNFTQLSAIEKARLYAEQGIWYDALTTLGMEKRTATQPASLRAWDTLLQQAELESMISIPLQPCCQLP